MGQGQDAGLKIFCLFYFVPPGASAFYKQLSCFFVGEGQISFIIKIYNMNYDAQLNCINPTDYILNFKASIVTMHVQFQENRLLLQYTKMHFLYLAWNRVKKTS